MRRAICLLAAMLSSNAAWGAIELRNDALLPVSSDGANLTFDSDTSLEWLDLGVTRANNRPTILTRLAAGGDLEGFRVATHAEFDAFLDNAGHPIYQTTALLELSPSAGYSQLEALRDFLVGSMSALFRDDSSPPDTPLSLSLALLTDPTSTSFDYQLFDFIDTGSLPLLSRFTTITNDFSGNDGGDPRDHWMLVRDAAVVDPVPEPAVWAIWLLGGATAGVLAKFRRRR